MSQEMIIQKFEALLQPEPNSGCWIWVGYCRRNGYGQLWDPRDKKTIRAHRLSYELYRGPFPLDLFVLHKCDTPCCVNPDHLFLGTHADNLEDCINKGRFKRGPLVPHIKLSLSDALFIRSSSEDNDTLAERYGITRDYAGAIKRGERWRRLSRFKEGGLP